MGIAELIRRVRRTFAPLEQGVLEAVEAALGGDARERYRRQIEAVNKVQRHGGAREVNLYRLHGGRPRNDPAIAFADQRLEAELARVRFRVPGEGRTRSATVHLVQGFVFSLVFDPPAEPVLERDDVEIVEVRLVSDPEREREPAGPRPAADPEDLTGGLRRWNERFGLSAVGRPLTRDERRERLGEIPARLPADYLRLTEQAEGFVVGPWKVHGLREVYGIALDEAEYQVLAELRDRGVVAVQNETSDLFFLPFDGRPRRRVDRFTAEVETRLESADAAG